MKKLTSKEYEFLKIFDKLKKLKRRDREGILNIAIYVRKLDNKLSEFDREIVCEGPGSDCPLQSTCFCGMA